MTNVTKEEIEIELPLDALVLQCEKDRYKIGYAALRWAKEIKQKDLCLIYPLLVLVQLQLLCKQCLENIIYRI